MVSQRYMIHCSVDLGYWSVDLPSLGVGNLDRGQIIGLSSYKNQVSTVTVKLDSNAIYYDLPLNVFSRGMRRNKIQDTIYKNNPSESFIAFKHSGLDVVQVFNKDKTRRCFGSYKMSIEWPEYNWLVHIIETENSLIAWPNFLVLWDKCPISELPDLGKLRCSLDLDDLIKQ